MQTWSRNGRRTQRAAGVVSLFLLCACGQDSAAAGSEPIQAQVRAELVETARAAPGQTEAGLPEPDPVVVPVVPEPPLVIGRTLVVDRSDLPAMIAKKRLRVLVPFAPPYFFFDKAEPRGITYEMFREYGQFIEQQEGMRRGDLTVVYIPCELSAVIPWLKQGYGDIAASALTITPQREQEVAFTAPLLEDVAEIIVTSRDATGIVSLDDLAGREVWVTSGSSYVEHLRALSSQLVSHGLEPIDVHEAPATLSTEDLLEMVSAGILDLMVSDDYKAELWAEMLPGLKLREDLVVHAGGRLAWAVRRDNPELQANLNAFVGQAKKGTLLGNILFKRYFGSTKWIENPGDPESAERIARYSTWMKELAAEYEFDWLRVAAQCFQESGLDPRAVSRSGAIGLMQLLPSTAKDMQCDDPYDPEQNLRAGVRYLDWLRTNFFADPELDEIERMDFILAAYNAGPGNVRKWRKLAPERGLDPNRWRENVERLALESVGVQPIRYVNNIEKYHVAYTLAQDLALERRRLLGDDD